MPCCTAVVAGSWRPLLSINISCPHGTQQQTCRMLLLLSTDGTDGQTFDRFIDPAEHSV